MVPPKHLSRMDAPPDRNRQREAAHVAISGSGGPGTCGTGNAPWPAFAAAWPYVSCPGGGAQPRADTAHRDPALPGVQCQGEAARRLVERKGLAVQERRRCRCHSSPPPREAGTVDADAVGVGQAGFTHAMTDMFADEHLPAGPEAAAHGAVGVRLFLLLAPTWQPEQECAARNRAFASARQMGSAGAPSLARVVFPKHRVLLRRPVARSARLHCRSAERLSHLPIQRPLAAPCNPGTRRNLSGDNDGPQSQYEAALIGGRGRVRRNGRQT